MGWLERRYNGLCAKSKRQTEMPFQILALSGGGYLGLFSAKVLARIEEQIGGPIARHFDLIAGTSIGGILALGLSLEHPAGRILEVFERRGSKIFSDIAPPKSRVGKLWESRHSWLKPKYSSDALREALAEILQENLIGNAKHPVIVPTVNMTRGNIQIFKTPHDQRFGVDHAKKMIDVALATSAAPIYFPLAEIDDSLYADGGVFANAPDLCAVHEATHFLGVPRDEISVLSIGTTTSIFSLSHAIGRHLGAWQWAATGRLWATISSSQQQLVHFMMEHQFQDRYLRIDATQSPEQQADLGIDVATPAATQMIKGMADGAYQTAVGNQTYQSMLKHVAKPHTFFYGPNANADRS
jgi:predicted acylesterase/phospholipase RssA